MRGGGGERGTEWQIHGRVKPRRGWTESKQGEGASEKEKVDEREKGKGKLRESGEERRANGTETNKKEHSSTNQPSNIPLTAAVIQTERRSLVHQEKIKNKNLHS